MLAEALSASSTGEGSAFKFIHTVVDRILPALAVDWRLLPVLCHKGFPIRQLVTWQPVFSEQGARRARERRQKQEGRQSLPPHLITFAVLYSFEVRPAHTLEKGISQGREPGGGNMGPC